MDPSAGHPLSETVVALVLFGLLVGAVATPAGAQADGPAFALAQESVDADAVLLTVDLQGDGDAHWRIEYRVRLDNENTTAAFEDLQADVDRNESAYVTRFEDRMTTTVGDAASTTGRDMAVRNVTVTTTTQQLPEAYGVLVYTFEWTGFAVVEGDELRAGDALAGFFLDADSSLIVAWPDGYSFASASPDPSEQRERSVVWRGPIDFGADGPRLVVSTAGPGDGVGTSLVGIAVVVAVLVGGGALWWWRHRAGDADRGTTDVTAGEPAGGGATGPPAELLSNEERVVALIEQHGGRMKQQAVVEELGWTDAKTSQVVGKLRDSGDIEGFRLGRENVLRLPEVDESPAPGDLARDADEEDDAE